MDWIRTLFDIEAQGLRRTGSFGRPPEHALRISQLAWQTRAPGLQVEHSAYTDIIPRSLLARHGVTLQSTGLAAGASSAAMSLPADFLRALTERRAGSAGYWDVGIMRPDNPLHDIFRRHVEQVLREPDIGPTRIRTEQDVVRDLLEDLIKGPVDPRTGKRNTVFGLRGGAKRELSAWNLTYDWGFIRDTARKGGHWHYVRELLHHRRQGTFRFTDSRTKWSEFVFEMMRDDPKYAPRYTVASRVQALRAKLAPGAVPTVEQLMGLTTTHDSLRSFLDDWFMAQKQGHGGIWRERIGRAADTPVGRSVVDILESASRKGSFHDYEWATLRIRRMAERHPEAARIVDAVWKPAEGHMSVLGRATRGREMEELADTAFNFVLGGKQARLVDLFSGIKNESGNPLWPDLDALRKNELYRSHEALSDVQAESRLVDILEDLNRPDADPGRLRAARRAMKEADFIAAGVLENLRTRAAPSGAPQGPVPTAGTGGRAPWLDVISKGKGKLVKDWRAGLAGVALGGGVLYLLSERNREMEGIRQPESIWREVEGIRPGGETRSDFSSGRNPFSQLLGTPYGPQVQWLPAGQLGMRGDELYRAIVDERQEESETLRKGSWVGRVVAEALGGQIAGTEHYVADPALGVHGYIDILLASGIPLEVKTVASQDELLGLKGPKDTAVSQANFYAHAMGAPYSYVAYFARDDPGQYRLFRVDYDAHRLMADRYVVADAYRTATEQGLYRPTLSGNLRILQQNGLEKVWSSLKREVLGTGTYGLAPNLYPVAPNAFDAIDGLGDYGRLKRAHFRHCGHGGLVQSMHYNACGSRIRDQRTRLQRVNPMVPQTPRGQCHPNRATRCETR